MAKACVIILHYKNEQDTKDCLSSLFRSKSGSGLFSTIIVANSPLRLPADFSEHNGLKTILIQNKENLGYAQGNNIGIRKAFELKSKFIILLNNDTVLPENLISDLIEEADKHSQAGIFSPKIYFAPGDEYHRERYQKKDLGKVIWYAGGIVDWQNVQAKHRGVDEIDQKQYEEKIDTDFATGCCMLIRREVAEKAGFFDEKYFLYYEDVDYCVRVKKLGFRIEYNPCSYLWHKNASSSGKAGSEIHQYYQSRNRLYFGNKYAKLRAKKSFFIQSLKEIWKNDVAGKAALDYYLGKMGKRKS